MCDGTCAMGRGEGGGQKVNPVAVLGSIGAGLSGAASYAGQYGQMQQAFAPPAAEPNYALYGLGAAGLLAGVWLVTRK